MKSNHLWLLLSIGLLAISCKKDPVPGPECNFQIDSEARFFEFITERGQTFQAWTTDTTVINQVLAQVALPQNERNQHINGAILKNPEGCALNQEWSWYFDPTGWAITEVSIELCDGDPQYVEDNLDEYIRIGGYCPWSSVVLREIANPF